jgi:hypothetical protein
LNRNRDQRPICLILEVPFSFGTRTWEIRSGWNEIFVWSDMMCSGFLRELESIPQFLWDCDVSEAMGQSRLMQFRRRGKEITSCDRSRGSRFTISNFPSDLV